jgi:rhamnosyltransferase
MPNVTIIIPTAGWPDRRLDEAVTACLRQTVTDIDILIIDSSGAPSARRAAFEALGDPRVRLHAIAPTEFSHGRTRNLAVSMCRSEFVAFLSDDAVPADEHWLAGLLDAIAAAPDVIASYSRQIPRPEHEDDRYFYEYWFPAGHGTRIRRKRAGDARLGDFFFSNAASCYKRDALASIRFNDDILMSEDQDFARRALEAGHAIAYAHESVVLHSHAFGLVETFKRYFDSAHTLRGQVKDPLEQYLSTGSRFVIAEIKWTARHAPFRLPRVLLRDAFKFAGTLAGRYAHLMPQSVIRMLSAHPAQWR